MHQLVWHRLFNHFGWHPTEASGRDAIIAQRTGSRSDRPPPTVRGPGHLITSPRKRVQVWTGLSLFGRLSTSDAGHPSWSPWFAEADAELASAATSRRGGGERSKGRGRWGYGLARLQEEDYLVSVCHPLWKTGQKATRETCCRHTSPWLLEEQKRDAFLAASYSLAVNFHRFLQTVRPPIGFPGDRSRFVLVKLHLHGRVSVCLIHELQKPATLVFRCPGYTPAMHYHE